MKVILLLHRNSDRYEKDTYEEAEPIFSNPTANQIYENSRSLLSNKSNTFTLKLYSFFIFLSLFCYMLNLNYFFFIGSFVALVIPQIVKNYLVGHHLKKSMKYFMYYILPRYSLLVINGSRVGIRQIVQHEYFLHAG